VRLAKLFLLRRTTLCTTRQFSNSTPPRTRKPSSPCIASVFSRWMSCSPTTPSTLKWSSSTKVQPTETRIQTMPRWNYSTNSWRLSGRKLRTKSCLTTKKIVIFWLLTAAKATGQTNTRIKIWTSTTRKRVKSSSCKIKYSK